MSDIEFLENLVARVDCIRRGAGDGLVRILAQVIKRENCGFKFLSEIIKDDSAEILASMFLWDETLEGHRYWESINSILEDAR